MWGTGCGEMSQGYPPVWAKSKVMVQQTPVGTQGRQGQETHVD